MHPEPHSASCSKWDPATGHTWGGSCSLGSLLFQGGDLRFGRLQLLLQRLHLLRALLACQVLALLSLSQLSLEPLQLLLQVLHIDDFPAVCLLLLAGCLKLPVGCLQLLLKPLHLHTTCTAAASWVLWVCSGVILHAVPLLLHSAALWWQLSLSMFSRGDVAACRQRVLSLHLMHNGPSHSRIVFQVQRFCEDLTARCGAKLPHTPNPSTS